MLQISLLFLNYDFEVTAGKVSVLIPRLVFETWRFLLNDASELYLLIR